MSRDAMRETLINIVDCGFVRALQQWVFNAQPSEAWSCSNTTYFGRQIRTCFSQYLDNIYNIMLSLSSTLSPLSTISKTHCESVSDSSWTENTKLIPPLPRSQVGELSRVNFWAWGHWHWFNSWKFMGIYSTEWERCWNFLVTFFHKKSSTYTHRIAGIS